MKTGNICMIAMLTALFAGPAFCADLDVGDGDNDNTYTATNTYAAATKIVKTGTGKTTLNFGTYTTNPGFTGEIEVQEGTLAVHGIANIGTPSKITVSDGATLDLTTNEGQDPVNLVGKEIVISGSGQNGAGALVRGGIKGVNNLFRTLTLAADAKITLNAQIGLGDGSTAKYGVIKLNGHTLTKSGTSKLYCPNVQFYGSDGTTADPGNIVVTQGTLFLQNGNALSGGNANNSITLQAGAELQLRNTNPIYWSVNATGENAKIWSDGSPSADGRHRLCGPVRNSSAFILSPGGSSPISLYGNSLTLEGGLTVNGTVPTTFTDVSVTNKSVDGIIVKHSSALTRLILNGNTFVTSETNASGRAKTRIIAGSTATGTDNARGVIEICDNTIVTNFGLAIGRSGFGAVDQKGGRSFWLATNAAYDRSAMYPRSYGYLGLTGGKFVFDGDGPTDSNKKSSHFAVYGGFVMDTRGGSADFLSSDKIGFASVDGGTFVYLQGGGSTNFFSGEFGVGLNEDRDHSGHGFLTVTGSGTKLKVGSYLRFLYTNAGAEAFLNINDGGMVATKYIYRLSTAYPFYLNLDGGVIAPLQSNSEFAYRDEAARYPTAATVYEGGVVFDTTETRNGQGAVASGDMVTMKFPFVAPGTEGKRVESISLPSAIASAKLAGPPLVTVSGDGQGASAVALFDSATGYVTNILVTSHGWGYTAADVTFKGAGLEDSTHSDIVVLADQPSSGWKGLTKRGATTLRLSAANTFKGDVTVEGGLLSFNNSTAPQGGMPEGAGITVKDGAMISFAAASTAVTVPFIAGCGSTSYGYFTVTNRIECTAEDIFAGRHLRIGRRISLADGVKIVLTDPENLSAYRNSGRAVVLEAGTDVANDTLTCAGRLELDFGSEAGAESASRWSLRATNKQLTLGSVKGLQISFM